MSRSERLLAKNSSAYKSIAARGILTLHKLVKFFLPRALAVDLIVIALDQMLAVGNFDAFKAWLTL